MDSPINKLTGGALAVTGGVLAIAAVVLVLLSSSGTGTSDAQAAPPAYARSPSTTATTASSATTIATRKTSVGTILVGPGGETVYAFTRDHSRHDVCASVRGCLKVWPMVAAHGSVRTGPGIKRSLLSTITVGGVRQVTYAGHPLYGYAEDSRPGDTDYVGVSEFGGSWPAVSPTGGLVH